MKKPYRKPALFAETFELNEHIAGNCSVSGYANHKGIESCGFDNGDPNGPIFISSKCNYDPTGGLFQTDEDLQDPNVNPGCYYSNFAEGYIAFSS